MLKNQRRVNRILFILVFLIVGNDFLPGMAYPVGMLGITIYTVVISGEISKIKINGALKWYFLYLAIMLFECMRGKWSLSVFVTLVPTFLAFFVVAQIVSDSKELDTIIHYFAILGCVLCIYLLIRYRNLLGYSRFGNNGKLIGTSITTSIGLSYYLICIICTQIWCTIVEIDKKKKIFYFISMLPTGVLILFSGVRKAIILPIVFVLVILLYGLRKHKTVRFLLLIGLGFAVISICYFIYTVPELYNILGNRMASLFKGTSATTDYSSLAREQLAFTAVDAFFNNPILGKGVYGAKHYFETVPGIIHNSSHPHNNYLNLLVIGGVPLLLLFYIPPLFSVVRLFKKKLTVPHPGIYLMAYYAMTLVSDMASSSYNIILFNFFTGLMFLALQLAYK